MNDFLRNTNNSCLFFHYFFDLNQAEWKKLRNHSPLKIWDCLSFKSKKFWPDWANVPNLTLHRAYAQYVEFSSRHTQRPNALTIEDDYFPTALRDMPNSSPVIYTHGDCRLLESENICVVGTRQPSPLGIVTTRDCTDTLVNQAAVTITSGLARGVDIEAHKTTLRYNGKTIAVLGSGLNKIYPKNHTPIVDQIYDQGGLIISPFPEHAPPLPFYFPRRNLLMARLSKGTVCIEGSLKSGSLITGKASLDLGHTTCVFTQDYRSDFGKGAIELIRLGAEPVTSMQDLLEKLAFPLGGQLGLYPTKKSRKPSSDSNQEFSISTFASEQGIPIREATIKIQKMILEGEIEATLGQSFIYCRK